MSHVVLREPAARMGLRVFAAAVALTAATAAVVCAEPAGLRIVAADGVSVYADLYRRDGGARGPLLLLFHQAGSNAAEYEPIAPRLNELGWDALAIDQRSGGHKWGRGNRTVGRLGHSTTFPDAYADLEAALDWARSERYAGPVVVVGSSYSAALVLRLAAEREVDGVVALSPGEHAGEGFPVRGWASGVRVPALLVAMPGPEQYEAQSFVDAIGSPRKRLLIPASPAHAAAVLREDRNPGGTGEVWDALTTFLADIARPVATPNAKGDG